MIEATPSTPEDFQPDNDEHVVVEPASANEYLSAASMAISIADSFNAMTKVDEAVVKRIQRRALAIADLMSKAVLDEVLFFKNAENG